MMSSGIPSRMWFSSHSNVWSSVVSVAGNENRKILHFSNIPTHHWTRELPATPTVLFITEQQLEVKCRMNKHFRMTPLAALLSYWFRFNSESYIITVKVLAFVISSDCIVLLLIRIKIVIYCCSASNWDLCAHKVNLHPLKLKTENNNYWTTIKNKQRNSWTKNFHSVHKTLLKLHSRRVI